MLVDLENTFKFTPAYFLIETLTGKEHANLVTIMLKLLSEYKIHVHSLTYDGDATNASMIKALGANVNLLSKQLQFYFLHPSTERKNNRVYIFPDPSHMLKNVHNAFTETSSFFDAEGQIIDWDHILDLVAIQNEEGLFISKLTERHTQIDENEMNVHLAAQVLSNSTSNALTYLKTKIVDTRYEQIQNTSETAKFCKIFNDAFDFLNCPQRYSHMNNQPFNIALCEENKKQLKQRTEEIIQYIRRLRNTTEKPINQKTVI